MKYTKNKFMRTLLIILLLGALNCYSSDRKLIISHEIIPSDSGETYKDTCFTILLNPFKVEIIAEKTEIQYIKRKVEAVFDGMIVTDRYYNKDFNLILQINAFSGKIERVEISDGGLDNSKYYKIQP